ncbi:MAG: sulfotransferase [Bacteroidota bacterium]
MAEHPFFIQRSSTLQTINRVGKALKFIGLNSFALKPDSIIAKAKKDAGYTGEIPGQVEIGLKKLIDSINTEGKPNAFGSLAAKSLFERTVYGRLKVEQQLKKNSEILNSEIKEPVFIVGMPRTGTTILHALMHEDPAHRSPLSWECLRPYPVPTPENFHDNEQLKVVAKEFDQLFKLVPDFQQKHHMEADSPQECIGINMFDFNSFQTVAQFYIPSYLKWFNEKANKLATMRFHKTFIQYLQSGGVKGDRWLLKSPVHLMRLKEIFEVYPDAKIIMTHRHPARVASSVASLVSSVRSLYSDHEDALRTGAEQSKVWSDYFNTFLESRRSLDKEDQIIDIKFDDFVKDQLTTVKGIYASFGWNLSEEAELKMNAFLSNNPKDKHGAHNHSLEAFGLSEDGINGQYKNYINFLEELE